MHYPSWRIAMNSRHLVVVVAAAAMVVTAVSAASGDDVFRAGTAMVDISPQEFPVRIAGSINLTLADKTLDPLYVRAMVLDNGAATAAIALIDSCMVDRETLDAAKAIAERETGISAARMVIASTHTHSAPAAYGCHGNDAEAAYVEFLIPRVAAAIVEAYNGRIPARVGWAKADCPEFVHCRRWIMKPGAAENPPAAFTGQAVNIVAMNPGYGNPDKIRQTGPVDPAVTVLSVQTTDGKPLGMLANYSTHYAGVAEPGVSSDYFGEFCRMMARDLGVEEGKPFVAILSNGTSGDANAIDYTKPGWKNDRFLVARAVAAAAVAAMKATTYRDWAPIAMAEQALTFKVRKPADRDRDLAREYLASSVGDRPTRTVEENYARETVLIADWPDEKELKLQALRVGEFAIATSPCETYGSTGLAVKQRSPFDLTMVISLANGCSGYLPPPDQFELGGYTTWRARTSYLEVGAEPRIRETLGTLLDEVASSVSAGHAQD